MQDTEISTTAEQIGSLHTVNGSFYLRNWSKLAAKHALVVFLVASSIFTTCLLNRPFFTRGEAREALVVQAMVQQGNFVLPLTNSGTLPHKPPMFHWLGVLCSKVFAQVSEFTVRLPSALVSAATLAIFFLIIAHISNRQRATLSTLILGTTFEWFRSSTHARVDMCLAGAMTVALYSLYIAIASWKTSKRTNPIFLTLAALATAVAVLSKGPGVLLIICAVVGLYLFAIFEDPLIKSVPKFPWKWFVLAFCGSLLLAGSWYYLAFARQGSDFLTTQIFKENYARFVSVEGSDPGHGKPFFYVFIHIIVGFLPWSLFFPPFLAWAWENRSQFLSKANHELLFSAIWLNIFLAIVGFSIAKRMVYLLPAYPPLAFLLSVSIEETWKKRKSYKISLFLSKWAGFLFGSVLFLALSLLCLLGLLAESSLPSMTLRNLMSEQAAALTNAVISAKHVTLASGALALVLLIVTLHIRKNFDPRRSPKLLSGLFALLFATTSLVILPIIAEKSTPKHFLEEISSLISSDTPLFEYRHMFFPAIYYAQRPIKTVSDLSILNETPLCSPRSQENGDIFLILRTSDKMSIFSAFPETEVVSESSTLAANGEEKLLFVRIPRQVPLD